MAGKVVPVPFGERALGALRDAIQRAQSNDQFAPVTVIVPTRRAALSLKSALSLLSEPLFAGLVNVRFVVLSDVAELLGSPAALQSGRVRLTRIVLGSAARRALRSSPGFLEPIAYHASTEDQLVESYENLRDAGADAISILARRGTRQRDLVQLCRAMRRLLEQDFFDDVDLVRFALDNIKQSDIDALGSVIVHLPSRMRSFEVELIAALGHLAPCTVHLGAAPNSVADDTLQSMVTELTGAGLELVGAVTDEHERDAKLHIEVAAAPDPIGEIDDALRVTIAALEDGTRADRITWSYCAKDPYARLIESALVQAGLAWNGPSSRSLDETPLAQFVLGLLDLVIYGLSRARMMRWLASSPIKDAYGRAVPFGEWERVSRLAGILDHDLSSWCARLGYLIDFVDSERKAMASFDENTAQLSSGRAQRRKDSASRTVEATRSLLRFLDSLALELSESDSISTFSHWSLWIERAIENYLGLTRETPIEKMVTATAEVLMILDELSSLDRLESFCDASDFRAAFVGAVVREAPPVGNRGVGITVGPFETALGTDVELLIVIGASEGALPRPFRRSTLLDAADEQAIGLHDRSVLGHFARERRRFLGSLGSARRRVVLSPIRATSGRTTTLRSRFIGELEGLEELIVEPARVEDEIFVRESALAVALLSAPRAHDRVGPPRFLFEEYVELARASMAIKSHHERRFDAYAGNVGQISTDLGAEIFSPTTLESYANCPFRFFLSHELGIEAIEPPEARMGIDPRSRGELIHGILERFVRAQLVLSGEEWIDRKEAATADLETIAYEEFDKRERRGVVGRRLFWERDRRRILEILQSERIRDERRRAAGTRPVAVELVFGTADLDPVAIEVGGETVLFRGKIDRVDMNHAGELEVIDYKTGSIADYRSIGDDPVDKGRHLQLPIYGLAARAWAKGEGASVVRSAFRFLDVNGQEVDVVLDERTERRFKEVLDVLIHSIEAGAFPVHPGVSGFGGPKNCRWCDYNELCRSDRAAVWESVRLSDPVRRYASLVGGEDDE